MTVELQKDLDMLFRWSFTFKLLFSPLKNFLMSFKVQLTVSYSIGTNAVPKVSTHRDLWVIISSDLDWEPYLNKMLGLLRWTFSSKITSTSKKQLYILLVRSQLMFCSILQKPYFLKGIRQLEQLPVLSNKVHRLHPCYDSLSLVDSRVVAIENSVLEIGKWRNSSILIWSSMIVCINLLLTYLTKCHLCPIRIKHCSNLLKPLFPNLLAVLWKLLPGWKVLNHENSLPRHMLLQIQQLRWLLKN